MKNLFLGLSFILFIQTSLYAMNLEKQLHTARIKSLQDECRKINSNIFCCKLGFSSMIIMTPLFLALAVQKYNKNGNIASTELGIAVAGSSTCLEFRTEILNEKKKIDQIKSQIKTLEKINLSFR